MTVLEKYKAWFDAGKPRLSQSDRMFDVMIPEGLSFSNGAETKSVSPGKRTVCMDDLDFIAMGFSKNKHVFDLQVV